MLPVIKTKSYMYLSEDLQTQLTVTVIRLHLHN